MYTKIAGGTTAVGLTGGSLANTGSEATAYAIAAVTLVLAGAAIMRLSRRFRIKKG